MQRYAFRVEYDGAPFAGWQAQAGQPSVQGAIESALAKLDPGFAAGGDGGFGLVAHFLDFGISKSA